jgi:hypothetical protein
MWSYKPVDRNSGWGYTDRQQTALYFLFQNKEGRLTRNVTHTQIFTHKGEEEALEEQEEMEG